MSDAEINAELDRHARAYRWLMVGVALIYLLIPLRIAML